DDILLIVEPVLMAPLRREWESVKEEVRQLKDNEAKGVQKKISDKLRDFANKIAAIKVLDPACGSGNFLYVALRLLLDLQNEVINFSDEMGVRRFFISVTPAQLYGIEINEYAHELAQMTIQIGYIQWLCNNGYGQPAEPILKPAKNILQMDAILAYDEKGTPFEPGWSQVDIIMGNPPFLGDKKMRSELGHKYVEDLRKLYRDRIPGQSDLVCYWFEKARAMVEKEQVNRVGLLATQAIRHGSNRTVLDRITQIGNIFLGIQNQEWILDGASVRVSMVGFDNGTERLFELDGKSVSSINSDLTSAIDLTKAQKLSQNQSIAFIGTQKGGPFDIPEAVAIIILADTGNPNGLTNSDVVRPWINGSDIAGRPSGKWIIFFGTDMPLEEASLYEKPFEYIKKNVKVSREAINSEQRTTEKWWLHQRPRPEMWIA
ncbi:MAG TPA: DNA methyltransferase, partial [Anaerolineales bacterium]|nr:DNA methyltransferase [Anaerolineales bacterium]